MNNDMERAGVETQPFEWKPGDVVDGVYEVRGVLGEGGMGAVHRVFHRGWAMEMAVKSPRPSIFGSERGMEDFVREAQSWVNLGAHPNVVTCYFARVIGGVPRVFAECVNGGSLRDWVWQGRVRELATVLDIAIQAAWGLHFAHERGLVHQDVKPANILLSRDGVAKVTDFGLARARAEAGEVARAARNAQDLLVSSGGATPAYCSPEQARGERLTLRTDVWSWATSVLEMLTGRVVWRRGQIADRFLRSARDRKDAHWAVAPPAALAEVLAVCLNPLPQDRPADMLRVARKLRAIYRDVCRSAYPRTEPDLASVETEYAHRIQLNNRAVSLIELGQTVEAVALLDEAASQWDFQEAAYNRCLLDIKSNRRADLNDLGTRVPLAPDVAKGAYLAGLLLLEMGDFAGAVEKLEEAVGARAPFAANAYAARGIGLLLMGETQPAILSFREALRHEPERLDILRNLALAYYYDGGLTLALRLFRRIAGRAFMDSEDCARYAAVLSAAGLREEATQWARRALAAPDATSMVKLTVAEIACGAQTFLPGATPLGAGKVNGPGLAREVARSEPHNLRARIDAETLPDRYGLSGRPKARKGKRVCPEGAPPSHVGTCVARSHRSMRKEHRWGHISQLAARQVLALVAGVPALPAALLSVALLFALFPETLGGWSEQVCLAVVFFVPALVVFYGSHPPNRILRAAFLFLVVPYVVLLAAVSPFLLIVSSVTPSSSGTTGIQAFLSGTPLLALGGTIVYIVWSIAFQRLFAWSRAAVPFRPIAMPGGGLGQGKWRTESSGEDAKRATGDAGVFHGYWKAAIRRLTTIPARYSPALVRLRHRLYLAVDPSMSWLAPQILLPLVVLLLLTGSGQQWRVPAMISAGSFGVLLAVGALSAPKLVLPLNSGMSLLVGVMFGIGLAAAVNSGPQTSIVSSAIAMATLAAIPIAFALANRAAMRRSPVLSPDCSVCNLDDWDIAQVLDPLDIRRHAAPWQLARVDRYRDQPWERDGTPPAPEGLEDGTQSQRRT